MVLIAPTARENAVLIDHQHHAIVLWLRRRCRLDRAEERSHHLEGIGTMARPAMAWRVSPGESCTSLLPPEVSFPGFHSRNPTLLLGERPWCPSGERGGAFRSEVVKAPLDSGVPSIHIAQKNIGSIRNH